MFNNKRQISLLKVFFRVDSSLQMGSGHLMRCLTLAEELKKNGSEITFISRAHEGNMNEFISKKDIEVVELSEPEVLENVGKITEEDNYGEWLGVSQNQDTDETIIALGNNKPDWLIVDHYALDEEWEKTIRPYVKNIMVIDDLANRHHDCDLLLDQNWFENMEARYDGLVPTTCTKILGPEYALLRPEFAEARKKYKPRNGDVKRIFVFFGGSDPHNLTGMTLRALSDLELAHMKVDAVIGENNPHRDELKKLVTQRPLTNLHIQVGNIATIMSKADLAIGSGGVNTWERVCLKLPALVVSFAENHRVLLDDLVQNKHVHHLGSVVDMSDFIIKKGILDKISKTSIQSEQGNDIFQLVNGQGTGKVAKKLMNKCFSISIISDNDSWINDYIPKFVERIEKNNHSIHWGHDIKEVQHGDICFLLSCSQIMLRNIMSRNKINLVVHESALPKGRGWSPLTWQIIEGKNRISISLLEVVDKVDSGKLYLQDLMVFEGHELIDELRAVQANYTFKLCEKFMDQFPIILKEGNEQKGNASFYKKREPNNSELNPDSSISENFNILRTVDNKRYPAFFTMKGKKYKLKIERYKE